MKVESEISDAPCFPELRLDIGSIIKEAVNKLREKLYNYNIVIVSVGPQAKVGAGHERQALAMRLFLEELGLGNKITYVSIPRIGLVGLGYPYLQRNPKLYNKADRFFETFPPPIINLFLNNNDFSKIVCEELSSSTNFNEDEPTVYIGTHVGATIAAANADKLKRANKLKIEREKEREKNVVFEYIPDPWEGSRLVAMRSPVLAEYHYAIVHNLKTVEEYLKSHINPGLDATRVLPLGTLSPVYLREQQRINLTSYPHFAIEFSGNRIPNYDEKVLRIIETMATDLREGKIRLTIHTMWHKETKNEIIKVLAELGLINNTNIRLIYNNDLCEALKTRQACILGDEVWPAPDAVISKGGEVPLEDRGNKTIVVVVYGEGHERHNTEVGEQEGRAVDMIDRNPEEVYKRIKEELKKPRKPPPPSLAPLAPLAHLDPGYFYELLRQILPGYDTLLRNLRLMGLSY